MEAALKLVPPSGWHPLDPDTAADGVDRMAPAAELGPVPRTDLDWWRWQLRAGRFGMVELRTGRDGTAVAGMVYRVTGGELHVVALARFCASDLDLIAAADDGAHQLAVAFGCTALRFETVRPGLVKQLTRRGWQTRNIELVRHVQ